MGAGFELLMSGTPEGILLGLGIILAVGGFIYFAVYADRDDKKR